MILYYLVTMILVLINLLIFIAHFEGKKINYYFTFINLIMVIACGGYLALALSENLQEAILANKIGYLGGCFIPPIVLFSIFTFLNIKVKSWVKILLYMYSIVVYTMILTIGYTDFYYTDVLMGKYGDATILIHNYGVGHMFFNVILYGHMIAQIAFLVYSLYKNHIVSHKNLWIMMLLEIVNIVLFIIVGNVNAKFEIAPLMYVVDGWILLYLHKRIMMYNIDDCVISSLQEQEISGYVVFDNRKRYLGSNDTAKIIIPELSECKVDCAIPDISKVECILDWIDDFVKDESKEFSYEVGNRHYQINIRKLWYKKKSCGYIVEMQEDTDKWNYMNLLSKYNSELESKVQEKTEHITNIQSQILVGMADMVENRDNNTGGHIKRTSAVIKILVDTIREKGLFDLEEEYCNDIIKAAPMHDLGKIGIDDTILRKPGRLTPEEFAVMKTHAANSGILVKSILSGVEEEHFVKVATNIARHHHEKWNGTGYPDNLEGKNIPLEARIMAIADVYDALVSKRCYKEAMSFEQAFEVMEESMGTHFDPELEPVFLLSRKKLEKYYREN